MAKNGEKWRKMAKNGDGEFAFFICQIRHFAIGPPPPPFNDSPKVTKNPRPRRHSKRTLSSDGNSIPFHDYYFYQKFYLSCSTKIFSILRFLTPVILNQLSLYAAVPEISLKHYNSVHFHFSHQSSLKFLVSS